MDLFSSTSGSMMLQLLRLSNYFEYQSQISGCLGRKNENKYRDRQRCGTPVLTLFSRMYAMLSASLLTQNEGTAKTWHMLIQHSSLTIAVLYTCIATVSCGLYPSGYIPVVVREHVFPVGSPALCASSNEQGSYWQECT